MINSDFIYILQRMVKNTVLSTKISAISLQSSVQTKSLASLESLARITSLAVFFLFVCFVIKKQVNVYMTSVTTDNWSFNLIWMHNVYQLWSVSVTLLSREQLTVQSLWRLQYIEVGRYEREIIFLLIKPHLSQQTQTNEGASHNICYII